MQIKINPLTTYISFALSGSQRKTLQENFLKAGNIKINCRISCSYQATLPGFSAH
jgi:hypothetical protein